MNTFFLFKVRSECPECGEPMMIDGPTLAMRCHACHSDVAIDVELWKRMMTFRRGPDLQGAKIVSTAFGLSGAAPFHVRMGRQPPACQACAKPLDLGAMPRGLDGEIGCACGQKTPTCPIPAWLRRIDADAAQLFNATRELHGTPVAVPREDRPISFGCPDCGANLKITMASPRILACDYCRADLFLPDALWHALHPVKKRSAWYIGFD